MRNHNTVYLSLAFVILFIISIFLLVDIHLRGLIVEKNNEEDTSQVHDNCVTEKIYKYDDEKVRFNFN